MYWNPSLVNAGETFENRTGTTYSVLSVDEKGMTLTKSSGKTQRVSAKSIERAGELLKKGEVLKFQANGSQGGISYTVAIESGVVFALSKVMEVVPDVENRVWRLA